MNFGRHYQTNSFPAGAVPKNPIRSVRLIVTHRVDGLTIEYDSIVECPDECIGAVVAMSRYTDGTDLVTGKTGRAGTVADVIVLLGERRGLRTTYNFDAEQLFNVYRLDVP